MISIERQPFFFPFFGADDVRKVLREGDDAGGNQRLNNAVPSSVALTLPSHLVIGLSAVLEPDVEKIFERQHG